MINWLRTWLEWTLLGIGIGCVATVGLVSLEAYRFERSQAAAFERSTTATPDRTVPAKPGSLVGLLSVPRLGLSTAVVEGDDSKSLKLSAGHLPDTPWPWQPGNSAIAAHRDGRFRALRKIKVGDEVRLRTSHGELRYQVRELSIVEPDDLSVLAPQEKPTLTLITCYPFTYVGNAPQRFIVRAERLASAAPAN
jgi:sortase A